MRELERLIQELCPNGVEYKSVGAVCDTITDYTAAGSFADIAKNVQYINNGKGFAQLVRTTDLKANFRNKERLVYVNEHAFQYLWRVNLDSEALVMPNVGNCGEVYYITPDIFPNEHNVLGPNAILVKSSTENIRFLYHLFLANEFQRELAKIVSPTGQTKFNKTNFKELKIPVPPIEVQREIVRILDNFTELTAELTDKLTAELTARKKQYDYYRDTLLTFGPETEFKALGDVCKLITGATPSKYKSEYWENGTISWMSSGEVNQKRVEQTENKITQLGYDNASTTMVPVHTVVIALAGQGKTRGKVAITEIELCTNQSLCSMVCNDKIINYKYLYYYLDSKYEELRAISNGDGTRGGLSLRILNPYRVPVPSLEEQQCIVDIIDRFDKLCNDISEGLPAEIEARQKQYEYYRDKLLTFKEIE